MIIEEIVLHNFGVFRGRQRIVLEPPSVAKPIVLFGGLNGSGKTTILDAISLGFYGNRAQTSNKGNWAYDEYLKRCIHRRVDPAEGAGLEVKFRSHSEGQDDVYRIHRSWAANGKSIRKRFEVVKNGRFDERLTRSWDEFVEGLMPASIANLFFFDGEQVKEIADLDRSKEVLTTAFNALLGLDTVRQLEMDLMVVERRKGRELLSNTQKGEVDRLQKDVNRLDKLINEFVVKAGGLKNQLDRGENSLNEAVQSLKLAGGDLYDQRQSIELNLESVRKELKRCEDRIRELAGGPAPILLVSDLLKGVLEQSEREDLARQAELVLDVITGRDEQILEVVRGIPESDSIAATLSNYLEKDRLERLSQKDMPRYLDLSGAASAQIDTLSGVVGEGVRRQAMALLQEASQMMEKLVDVERQIQEIPDQANIKKLQKDKKHRQREVDKAQARLSTLSDELERVRRERERKNRELVGEIEKALGNEFGNEDSRRIIKHSKIARQTLGNFRHELLSSNVARIQDYIAERFRHLMRKKELITKIIIDPDDFSIELVNGRGELLPIDRLSAGERQLLAVAILWGLARTSGRPLPLIVDTPLGRLDSSHRINLVERYFPFASHQVLLLSTDEEVNEWYYNKMKSRIGRSYRLDYSEESDSTTVRDGFFW